MSLDEHPIIFHIFSNGGAFFYQHVSLQMQAQNKQLQVKGVIFDSAPGERRFSSVYRALAAIIGGPLWYNVPVSLIATFFIFSFFILMVNIDIISQKINSDIVSHVKMVLKHVLKLIFFQAYIKGLLQFKKPQTEPIVLADEPYNWPQLFIYSKEDELVRYEDIERFAAKRKAKGVKVLQVCLENSPHVQHLITHREIYINTVVNFIQDCLNGNKGEK